jgi:two-component system OmpR family response regulator
VLRRRDNESPAPGDSVRFAGFRLDIARRELIDPDDVVIPLSAGEFRLLRAFVERPQRVLSREQLLDYAFDNDSDVFDRAVDVQVSRLRRKLERPGGIDIIRTLGGGVRGDAGDRYLPAAAAPGRDAHGHRHRQFPGRVRPYDRARPGAE